MSTMQDMNTQLWTRAQQQILANKLDGAEASLEKLLKAQPAHVPARLLLASVILAKGQVRGAAEQAKFAAFALPPDADMICRVAQCLVKVGETNAARACMQHPGVARSHSGPALAALAHIHQGLGQHVESLAMMDRARAYGFDNPDFRYYRAIQLQFNGRIAEAQSELEACLKMGPTYGRASLMLARMHRVTAQTQHLDFIRSRLAKVEQGSEDHAAFEFAQYKELEDLGDVDQAWAALERANAVMHGRLQHSITEEKALFDRLIEVCTADFVAPHRQSFAGPMPIFIIGMPRSGTTLLERIIGNHSQVTSAGELPDFARQLRWVADKHGHKLIDEQLLANADNIDFAEVGRRYLQQTQWRAQGRAWFVDKLPPNYLLAGLIHRALPQAKILHMVRDPMDVCFSNWRALFGDSFGYSYAFEPLAEHYRQYRRLMAHWHKVMPGVIHDVSYDAMVTETEATTRRLLDYCGLPFEPGCLETTRDSAPVATLSSAQVREPIHRRAQQEWRRYETQLEPLRMALGDLAMPM